MGNPKGARGVYKEITKISENDTESAAIACDGMDYADITWVPEDVDARDFDIEVRYDEDGEWFRLADPTVADTAFTSVNGRAEIVLGAAKYFRFVTGAANYSSGHGVTFGYRLFNRA